MLKKVANKSGLLQKMNKTKYKYMNRYNKSTTKKQLKKKHIGRQNDTKNEDWGGVRDGVFGVKHRELKATGRVCTFSRPVLRANGECRGIVCSGARSVDHCGGRGSAAQAVRERRLTAIMVLVRDV
uniref:Uncharacterized protein n=1 Tax=Schizaphis graminum TaxID=13262 RepID=A0A2S2N940_SCHGA